jgi:chromosome segregation ATPase
MDYEWKILMLDKEVAHLREMKDLGRGRMDAHGASIEALHGYLNAIAGNLKETTESLSKTAVTVEAISTRVESLSVKLDALVEALLREHPNGH